MNLSGYKLDICLLGTTLLILNAIIYIDVRHFAVRGLHSQLEESIELSKSIVNEFKLPRTAFYPPGIPILLGFIQFLGLEDIDPFAFNAVLLNAGTFVFYVLSKRIMATTLYSFLSVLLMTVNPYFVSTALLGRDVASEFLFSGLVFLSLFAYYKASSKTWRKAVLLFLAILTTSVALSLARVTCFFVVSATLALSIVVFRPGRIFFFSLLIAFVCFTLLFMYYNYRLVGSFTLSTNSGINLYIGNHPLYLHGHPHYDIDVFLGKERIKRELEETRANSMTETEEDAYFRKKAVEFIKSDIRGFLYRILVKSVWHWFNVEIVPNYTCHAYFDSEKDMIILESKINFLTNLAYVIYKICYLPLFILSIFFLFNGRIDRLLVVFYMPYLALWPIVALTFPDTRFKIVAEVCVLVPMMYSVCYWRRRLGQNAAGAGRVPHDV